MSNTPRSSNFFKIPDHLGFSDGEENMNREKELALHHGAKR